MKNHLLALTILISAMTSALGQGTLAWGNNFSGFRAAIFAPETGDPFLSLYGQSGQTFGSATSATDNPIGTVTYTGLLLSGTKYTFAVFAGPTGSLSNGLTFLGQTTFNTSTVTLNGGNVLPKGTVFFTTTNVPGVPTLSTADYQIRVWDNQNGTLTSWAMAEAAWLNNSTALGISPIVTSAPLGGTDPGGNVIAAAETRNFESFNIYYLPEPSVFALAGLGTAGMLIFRRRK